MHIIERASLSTLWWTWVGVHALLGLLSSALFALFGGGGLELRGHLTWSWWLPIVFIILVNAVIFMGGLAILHLPGLAQSLALLRYLDPDPDSIMRKAMGLIVIDAWIEKNSAEETKQFLERLRVRLLTGDLSQEEKRSFENMIMNMDWSKAKLSPQEEEYVETLRRSYATNSLRRNLPNSPWGWIEYALSMSRPGIHPNPPVFLAKWIDSTFLPLIGLFSLFSFGILLGGFLLGTLIRQDFELDSVMWRTILVISSFAFGSLLGWSQSNVLSKYVQNTKWWTAANGVGLAVATFLGGIVFDLTKGARDIVILPGFFGIILGFLLFAVITGLTLVWLLKHQQRIT